MALRFTDSLTFTAPAVASLTYILKNLQLGDKERCVTSLKMEVSSDDKKSLLDDMDTTLSRN